MACQLIQGSLRFSVGEDGAVGLERETHISGVYTPIDLERGVIKADGEFQVLDTEIAPAKIQGMGEMIKQTQRFYKGILNLFFSVLFCVFSFKIFGCNILARVSMPSTILGPGRVRYESPSI